MKQRLARADSTARQFEQVAATLVDPKNYVTGQPTPLMQRMADLVEMRNLHMITGDPQDADIHLLWQPGLLLPNVRYT